MRFLREWWDRNAWHPDAAQTRAKDQQVEQLRMDAINARRAREVATLVVVDQVATMRSALKAVADYRAAEQARLRR